ncbi:MAG: proton-conducting transporter membrane subunit [Chloroflexota bacterium]
MASFNLDSIPLFVWLIWLPLVWSPVVYLIGRIVDRQSSSKTAVARWVALLAIVTVWAPLLAVWQQFQAEGVMTWTYGSITLRADGLSLLLATAVLSLSTLVVLYSSPYMHGELGETKYYAMMLAITGVMIGLGCASDLFNLWLWFEAMAVTSYLLVAFYRNQPASLEAGIKYLVQSATGSVFVLLGVALVLSQTGTLDILAVSDYTAANPTSYLLLTAGALFVIGYGIKVAIVPLHTWLPDAHSQAPSGISAMLSGIVIEAGLIAMLRAISPLTGSAASFGVLLLIFGALNMLVGNLLALRQEQVKRMLAYSSLTHVGYMLVGLGIAISFHSQMGANGSFFHLLSHGMMKGLAFLSAGALLYAMHTARGSHSPLLIKDLAGASQKYPLIALVFSIALLGLGGLPPLVGFVSKWQIFVAGMETENLIIAGVIIFAALNSVLSLAYYAPLVNAVYRRTPSTAVLQGERVPVLMMIPLLVLTLAVVVFGIWPSLISPLVEPAAAALMAMFGG